MSQKAEYLRALQTGSYRVELPPPRKRPTLHERKLEVMRLIGRSDCGVTVREVADHLQTDLAYANGLLQNMRHEGHISLRRMPDEPARYF